MEEKSHDAKSKGLEMDKNNEWVVCSTVLDGALLLECDKTGMIGVVRDPTKEEWRKAFDAPSNPYRWLGGDERVEIIRRGHSDGHFLA